MSKRAVTSQRCIRCRINLPLCVCEEIKPISVRTNISLVVHVSELTLTSNTAQFIKQMIPDQAEIFIRGDQHERFSPEKILERSGQQLFLYPSEDSVELNGDFLRAHPGPHHLIVPDGKWTQAIKVRNREPEFKKMLAVKLPPGILAEYELRKARHPEWVSTYESVAHALGVLEGEKVRDDLMKFFRIWVKRTMYNRTGYRKYAED
jgi:DTW domain-containing protein YfiP